MKFHYTVGRTFSCVPRQPLSVKVDQMTRTKKTPTSSPRKRKSSSPRSEQTNPRCRSPLRSLRTPPPVDLVADDLESSTALSEVSLVVEVTTSVKRPRSERALSDVESDGLGCAGSPVMEKSTEMTDNLAVCCDASSVAVTDDVANHGTASMNLQSTSSLTEPRPLTSTAADSALSQFLDENLRDVMSMGFTDDGPDRAWMPTATIMSIDCLSGPLGGPLGGPRPLLGEVSEDASSDIDVELRRIVASVAHNHNNDEVNSVTSDDCGVVGCGTPDVPSLPVADLSPSPVATLLPLTAVSGVDDQMLTVLDCPSTMSSAVSHRPPLDVSDISTSHLTTLSFDAITGSWTSTLNVVTSTPPHRTATSPLVVCSDTPVTSTVSSSLTTSVTEESRQEVLVQEIRSQQTDQVKVSDFRQLVSCSVTENIAGSDCSQKQWSSDTTTANSDLCRGENTENLARSLSEFGQSGSVAVPQDDLDTVELSSCVKTVHHNNSNVTVTAVSVGSQGLTEASSTSNFASASTAYSSGCRQSSVVQTSPSTGCSSQPNSARISQNRIGFSASVTSTSASPSDRSSKSLESSSKKNDLSVNCVKTSAVSSHAIIAKSSSSPSSSSDVTASSERLSVATQTNTDLLGRYFHRRSAPVRSFQGAAKQSRDRGRRDKESSRLLSKSTLSRLASSSSGSSAYHFGSTSVSSTTVSMTSPTLAGGTVLLTSGTQVAPLIMPAIGPLSGMNGKTTFLITVPANFTLPASVGSVIGPTGTGPVSVGVSKASVTTISGSQLVPLVGGGVGTSGRLTATVSSAATALVLGQSALGTPLQVLVAAATALTTTSSTVALSRSSQSKQQQQQQQHSGVVSVVTCSSMVSSISAGVQVSSPLRYSVMTNKFATSQVSQTDSSVSHAQNGSVVRVNSAMTTSVVTSTRPTQVPVRVSTGTPSTVLMLPITSSVSPNPGVVCTCSVAVSPVSGAMLAIATSSSTVVVSSASMTTTEPRSSSTSSVSPTPGARHANIANLPRVAMRRRTGGASDVVVQSMSSSSVSSSTLGDAAATVSLLNGLGHCHTSPATVPAPSSVRHDGGGKSPVGGTTPTVVAKQPVHGEGAPTSIIRAILERSLSCPPSYNIDKALTGHHVAPPTPSPIDDRELMTTSYYTSADPTIQSSLNDERRLSGVDSLLCQPTSICPVTITGAAIHPPRDSRVSDEYAAARADRQNGVVRKRTAPPTRHPASAKYRRSTTDSRTSAQTQSPTINSNSETDLMQQNSSSAGTECRSLTTVDSSALGLSVCTSGRQQTGSSNGVPCENGQARQNEESPSPTSSGRSSTVSEPVQTDRTPSTTSSSVTRVALPKKVYAYLGSAGAGAARENAVAAAAALGSGDRSFQTSSPVALSQANCTGTATGRRSASDDGPISHLRLMCSGLAASVNSLELRTHSTA